MRPDLWVTADDYGLCSEINQGILELCDLGVVNRVSVVANGNGFDEAARELLKRGPRVETGVHLNLTDGRPVLAAGDTRSLVNARGEFPGGKHYTVAFKIALGLSRPEEIRKEWAAQIRKALNAGCRIRFINSHGHLHLLPQLQATVIGLLREFDIPYVRLVLKPRSLKTLFFAVLSRLFLSRMRASGLATAYPEEVLGITHQGALNKDRVLKELGRRAEGRVELIVHPAAKNNAYHKAWGYRTAEEFAGLRDPEVLRQLGSAGRPTSSGRLRKACTVRMEFILLLGIVLFAAILHRPMLKVGYGNNGDDYQEFSDTYLFHDAANAFDPGLKTVNTLKNSAYQPLQRLMFVVLSEFMRDKLVYYMLFVYVLFLISILCVYSLARSLLEDGVAALWAALLFSVHLSVFSVTRYLSNTVHVIQLANVFGMFFLFRGCLKSRIGPGYFFLVAWFTASLLFKETAVYAVLLMGSYDLFYHCAPRGTVKEKVRAFFSHVHLYYPFALISLAHSWFNEVYMRAGSVQIYLRQGDITDIRWALPRMLDYMVYALWPIRSNPETAWLKIAIACLILVLVYLALRSGNRHLGFCLFYSVTSLFLASAYLCPPIEENTRRFYPTLAVVAMIPGVVWKTRRDSLLGPRGWPVWLFAVYTFAVVSYSIQKSGGFS